MKNLAKNPAKLLFFGFLFACLVACSMAVVSGSAQEEPKADSLRRKYLEITEGWTHGAAFKQEEQQAMTAGRQWESLMTAGLDDPLAKKVVAAGEPSFATLATFYPGKILDRTVLGTWSDPRAPASGYGDEFVVWWNGAISANLVHGRLNGVRQPLAHNTNVLFRIGPRAEIFGSSGESYSRIGYDQGFLPIVAATYERDDIRYRETAFADKPSGETAGWDVAYVGFEMANITDAPAVAQLHADMILVDGSKVHNSGQRLLAVSGAVLLAHSDPAAEFDADKQRLTRTFRLKPGESASVFFKIPYLPDRTGLVKAAGPADFESAYRRVSGFWSSLLKSGATVVVPEERVNNVWRALLLQNFVLADGPRFTYGSGLRYNDSYYSQETAFGAQTFSMFGFKDYANALLPALAPISVQPDQAARKYQNRRAMPFHHLLETYRLTRSTELFDRFKNDFYRVAEEIIADRRSTKVDQNGARPLHWGLLPPDRPGVDLRASTQTVYVLGHNITNCQGLQDFAQFLVRTGIDRQRGERYLEEARDFRRAILEAMERAAIRVPGRPPFVDLQTLYFRQTPDYGPEPYDDLAMGRLQGTYYHYWVDMVLDYNFFNPADEAAQWMADYVAQRGGFVLGCTRARRQEGPYGWINNVYNAGYYNFRLRSGRVDDFLLGFYSRLAFGMTRHAFVASEGSPFIGYNTRNGGFVSADYSFPNSAANAETLWLLRSMLILEELRDNIETGDIHLMRGAPRAWFEEGKQIRVTGAPTYFGEISFEMRSQLSKRAITARITPPVRDAYRAFVVWFRHPQGAPIQRVTVNGSSHDAVDREKGFVRLDRGPKEFVVEAYY